VAGVGGDAPGIAGEGVVLSIAYFEQDMAFDKIAGLFVRVAVLRQDVVFIEKELGHQRALAKTKRLLPDTLNGFFVAICAMFAKYHFHCLKLVASSIVLSPLPFSDCIRCKDKIKGDGVVLGKR
jgi:hypothetical protein